MADAASDNQTSSSSSLSHPLPHPSLPPRPDAIVEVPSTDPAVEHDAHNALTPHELTPAFSETSDAVNNFSIMNNNNDDETRNQDSNDRNSFNRPHQPQLPKQPTASLAMKKIIDDDDNEDDEIHPESKWHEPWAEDGLTLYDIHREPLVCPTTQSTPTTPSVTIRIPLKLLDPEFQCVICLQYMNDPMIVMDCLHRFCGECIQKCLRLGAKRNECPTCRAPIPSRRSLRRDCKWNALIQHIIVLNQQKQQLQHGRDEQLKQSAASAAGGGQPKGRLSGDFQSTQTSNDPAPFSSNPQVQRKRARNLQDAIVEKQRAIRLRKQLEATEFRQQRHLLKQPPQPAAAMEIGTNEGNPDRTTAITEVEQPPVLRHILMLNEKSTTATSTTVRTTTPLTASTGTAITDGHTEASETQQPDIPLFNQHSPASLASLSSFIQLHLEISPLIDLQLVRHVHERIVQPLFRPFLTLHGDATVAVLQQFLSAKLSFPRADSFQIIGVVNKKPVRFHRDMTLFQVREACHRSQQARSIVNPSILLPTATKPFVLHYRMGISALRKPPMSTYAATRAATSPTVVVWQPPTALPTTLTNAPKTAARQRNSPSPKTAARKAASPTKQVQKSNSPAPTAPSQRLVSPPLLMPLTKTPGPPTWSPTYPPPRTAMPSIAIGAVAVTGLSPPHHSESSVQVHETASTNTVGAVSTLTGKNTRDEDDPTRSAFSTSHVPAGGTSTKPHPPAVTFGPSSAFGATSVSASAIGRLFATSAASDTTASKPTPETLQPATTQGGSRSGVPSHFSNLLSEPVSNVADVTTTEGAKRSDIRKP